MIKSAELEITGQSRVLFALVEAVSCFGVNQRSLLCIQFDVRSIGQVWEAVIGAHLRVYLISRIELKPHPGRAIGAGSQGVQRPRKARDVPNVEGQSRIKESLIEQVNRGQRVVELRHEEI